jgi:putative NADPH-quinone reductase
MILTMHTFIVLDHPYDGSLTRAAFNSTIQGLLRAGHTADVADLHADEFDPVLRAPDLARYSEGVSSDPRVSDYQKRIDDADHVIMVFPVWWQVMPAMSKGFLDKVLIPNWAFEIRDGAPVGLLSRLSVTLVTIMGSPATYYDGTLATPLHGMCRLGTWEFVGVSRDRVTWLNFYDVDNSTPASRKQWLSEIEQHFSHIDSGS